MFILFINLFFANIHMFVFVFVFVSALKTKIQLLREIGAIDPPCDAINLLVIGRIASGKSSYINTLKTVLRNSGKISTIQNVYGPNFGSSTKKVSRKLLVM